MTDHPDDADYPDHPDLLSTVLRLADADADADAAADAGLGFALLRRRSGDGVDVLVGPVLDVETLVDLPLPHPDGPPVLALVPFRQIRERGFHCRDDGAPLRCLIAHRHVVLSIDTVLAALPDLEVRLVDGAFDVDDDAYADVVRKIITNEIGHGEGANFVVRRDFVARLGDHSRGEDSRGEPSRGRAALALLRRLLIGEPGAYWTFAVQAGDVTMVGATPERHVSVHGGEVVMNPISGTYRYPPAGPTPDDLLRFLADPKETEELFMVVDEELKMMSEICQSGGSVLGPHLVQMSRLAHTEYELIGRTSRDVREVLRATMFAATVTGSPVQNACRVISRYESTGRGYYAGTLALLTSEPHGGTALDAPILIRTAYLGADGSVRVPVGATLVRHSVPESEVAETHAKVAGLLAAFGASPVGRPAARPSPPERSRVERLVEWPGVREALLRRNDVLSSFWMQDQSAPSGWPALIGRTALVVDAEDAWTAMLAHVLRRLGMSATVARWDDLDADLAETADLMVAGPGPGDPRDVSDPRVAGLHRLLAARLAGGRPTLAVCLSHQVLAALLGLRVGPLPEPYQGTQRRVRVLGRQASVGFYNTYSAWLPPDAVAADGTVDSLGGGLRGWAVPATGEVLALEGPSFTSVQFHLESVLSTDGTDLLGEVVTRLLTGRQRVASGSSMATPVEESAAGVALWGAW